MLELLSRLTAVEWNSQAVRTVRITQQFVAVSQEPSGVITFFCRELWVFKSVSVLHQMHCSLLSHWLSDVWLQFCNRMTPHALLGWSKWIYLAIMRSRPKDNYFLRPLRPTACAPWETHLFQLSHHCPWPCCFWPASLAHFSWYSSEGNW